MDFDLTELNKERLRSGDDYAESQAWLEQEPVGNKLDEIEKFWRSRLPDGPEEKNASSRGKSFDDLVGKTADVVILDELIPGAVWVPEDAEEEPVIERGKPDLVTWAAKLLKVPEPRLKRGYFNHYAEATPGEIVVNCPADELPRVIFHEMAHQMQFQSGLVILGDKGFYRGEEYPIGTKSQYWWAPWEIEARGMEEAILHEWGKCTQKKRSKHLRRTLARLSRS